MNFLLLRIFISFANGPEYYSAGDKLEVFSVQNVFFIKARTREL